MPDYLVEDNDTGIKLQVNGKSPPSQQDAHELVGDELKFLSTNLFSAPGGKFVLDVGPTAKQRASTDRFISKFNEVGPDLTLVTDHHKAVEYANDMSNELGNNINLWKQNYDQEKERLHAESKKNFVPKPLLLDEMLNSTPENSLMIVAHGAESGGFATDEGHKFTLHNVAQILGSNSNSISSVINAACYGGRCEPKDYQKYFPNVNDVQYGETNKKNVISSTGIASGEVFGPGVMPNRFQKIGPQWQKVSGPP